MNKNVLKIIAIIICIILLGIVVYGFVKNNFKENKNPIATIEVENYGTIKVELYPDLAPNTVANFITLANNGFYNGLTFHRTIPDFMIQGGDKNGDGTGNATIADLDLNSEDTTEYGIPGEFVSNGYENNTLSHQRGVISMARTNYGYNTASSQFFIMTKNTTSLDGQYVAFGKVINEESMEVVDKIANVEVITRDENEENADMPVEKPVITSITVETFGVDYKKPETNEQFDYQKWLMEQYGISF